MNNSHSTHGATHNASPGATPAPPFGAQHDATHSDDGAGGSEHQAQLIKVRRFIVLATMATALLTLIVTGAIIYKLFQQPEKPVFADKIILPEGLMINNFTVSDGKIIFMMGEKNKSSSLHYYDINSGEKIGRSELYHTK